jgi:hypothetical protein
VATDVFYNGVWLHNVTTREFVQETVYDSSHTDSIGVRFRLRFDGIIQLQTTFDRSLPPPYTDPGGSFDRSSPTDLCVEIRKRLSQPRGTLEVHTGDKVLLRCIPLTVASAADGDHDTDNGPKPGQLVLTQMYGNSIYRISFSIECRKVECADGYGVPVLINNRWAITEDMDDDFFTTRIIAGTITLSGAGFSAVAGGGPDPRGYPIHWWKGQVVPGVEPGFKRVGISFSASVDGLTAQYEIVDKQVDTAAPYPATKIEATHTESTADGMVFYTDVSVRLWGPPNVPKTALITRAAQIVAVKGQLDPTLEGITWMIQAAQITDLIGESNSIQMSVRVMKLVGENGYLANLEARTLGQTLQLPSLPSVPNSGYSPTQSPIPAAWGYDVGNMGQERRPTVLWLLSCYLQQPCSPVHGNPGEYVGSFPSTGDSSSGDYYDYPITEKSGTLSTTPSEGYSDSTKAGLYTYAKVESKYTLNALDVYLPVASTVVGGAVPADTDATVRISLARGQAWREITYEAERLGSHPELPEAMDSYTDGTLRGWLASCTYTGIPPKLGADGKTWIHACRATYTYRLNRAPTAAESVRVGVLPWTNRTQTENAIRAADVQTPLMAPGEPVS